MPEKLFHHEGHEALEDFFFMIFMVNNKYLKIM